MQATFFNSAKGANVAASFTADKIKDGPSSEVSLRLILGRSIVFERKFELPPFDCNGIVEQRQGIINPTYLNSSLVLSDLPTAD